MRRSTKSNTRLVVEIVVALAMVALLFWGQGNRREAARLSVQLADAEQRMSAMVKKEELDTARGRMAELEKTVARLESRLAPETEPEETSAEVAKPDEAAKTLRDMLASLSGKGGDEGEGEKKNPLLEMFSGESGKQLADYAARVSMDMAFGEFFQELSLPSETEQQVRDIIAAHMSEQIAKGVEVLQSGFDKEKLEEMEQNAEKRLREKLSRVLTPQEMDIWDEYAETVEERMLEQNYDMQLNMYAGGMTPENRILVRDVLVDEMLAIGEERDQGTGMDMGMSMDMDIEAALNMQLAAFERARERLAGELGDEQLTHFDRFVETQKQAFKMATALFGDLAGQQEDESEQE